MNIQEVLLNGHPSPIRLEIIHSNNLEDTIYYLSTQQNAIDTASNLPVKITCFVSSHHVENKIRKMIKTHEKASKLPVTVVVQPPLGSYTVVLLLWYMTPAPLTRTQHNNCTAVKLENGDQWLFTAPKMVTDYSPFDLSAERSLSTLFGNLKNFGFNFNHLLHTWFYIPQITGLYNRTEKYQLFNKYRKKAFLKQSDHTLPVAFYPASTGIGTNNNAVSASAIAFKSNTVTVHMMDNEHQVPAYHYPKQESIEPPMFSRGVCLLSDKSATMFVSGTASILESKTVHVDDIAAQTRQTIQNIHELLTQNAKRHKLTPPNDVGQSVKYATIYIKHEEDYALVEDICSSFFKNIPMIYVKADVCRDNLLVEIECIACMNTNQGGKNGKASTGIY